MGVVTLACQADVGQVRRQNSLTGELLIAVRLAPFTWLTQRRLFKRLAFGSLILSLYKEQGH